jgi:hypothetical protein
MIPFLCHRDAQPQQRCLHRAHYFNGYRPHADSFPVANSVLFAGKGDAESCTRRWEHNSKAALSAGLPQCSIAGLGSDRRNDETLGVASQLTVTGSLGMISRGNLTFRSVITSTGVRYRQAETKGPKCLRSVHFLSFTCVSCHYATRARFVHVSLSLSFRETPMLCHLHFFAYYPHSKRLAQTAPFANPLRVNGH